MAQKTPADTEIVSDETAESATTNDTDSGEVASDAAGSSSASAKDVEAERSPRDAVRTISISLPALLRWSVVAVALIAVAVACFGWWSARNDLDAARTAEANDRRAEQVATDYAVGASTIDHQNVAAWVAKLKANTIPQLANKFDATAPALEQILLPLKWTSTAAPITAKVASESGGVYKVNVFVNVSSTNAQKPDGGQMTVTYNVTVDSNNGWQITDVGGLDAALPPR
ncbi:hypothetical protein [Nocardia cyriacigeorgica]|uniref:hypothetical protein n=1 Tax=Nocardia cyriacigeorgica TaxID=135487 RepID=UPI002491D0A4|nr:hypothetical protein [Nocardia cyriacigeorgica]BDU05160.1 hypothetical protein FMUBM48_14230 [Nocardia cyriacigeorgica]